MSFFIVGLSVLLLIILSMIMTTVVGWLMFSDIKAKNNVYTA